MDPDKYQQAWRTQDSETRVTIDAELLRQEVRKGEQGFRSTIFWRDFREVGVALVMIPMWVYIGVVGALPWTWYLGVPAAIWLIGFLLIDRRRHPQTPSEPGEPLLRCVERSLEQVEHQIWLLRNVFWWYLLPFFLPITAFFAHVSWDARDAGWIEAIAFFLLLTFFVAGLYWWTYWINQQAVRKQLEPRRQELLRLRNSLREAASLSGDADLTPPDPIGLPTLPFSEPPGQSGRGSAVASIVTVLLAAGFFWLVAVFVSMTLSARTEAGHPKRSPFAAVRWDNEEEHTGRPEVRLGAGWPGREDEWFVLVSIDRVSAVELITFCKENFPKKWRKRFEEDLVEVMTRMGHPPDGTVLLVLGSLERGETVLRADVPMTSANRRAIRAAAEARGAVAEAAAAPDTEPPDSD